MKLDKNVRDKMRGLLPFDTESVEKFTPKDFKELDEKFQPIFHLKPWNQKQKDSVSLIMEKLQNKVSNSEKTKLDKELDSLCHSQVIDIENLYDIGKEEFITIEKENEYIKKEIWDIIPKKIQTSVYFCLSSISGLLSSEIVGL